MELKLLKGIKTYYQTYFKFDKTRLQKQKKFSNLITATTFCPKGTVLETFRVGT